MSDTNQTLPGGAAPSKPRSGHSTHGGGLFSTEDWWAVWIGLLVIVIAWALFASGSSIKWLAVAPVKWSSVGQAVQDIGKHLPNYAALFVAFALLFGVSLAALKQRVGAFLASFLILFVASALIFTLGAWVNASKYNLEPPLVALALGLLISNVFKLPEWFSAGLRVEFYIKVGIVLLGATLPFTCWCGRGRSRWGRQPSSRS